MTLLFRYIFSKNARLLLLIMGLGVGLYLLTELIERLDIFIDANAPVDLIAQYFAFRLPGIIAQILPAVFLLATVVTLCLMERSKELMALQAGGVSFPTIAVSFVISGIFWGVCQFSCSQFLSIKGLQQAEIIWQEEVRKRSINQKSVEDLWFMENGWFVHVDALTYDGNGKNFHAFHISETTGSIDSMLTAESVLGKNTGWTAVNAVRTSPQDYKEENFKTLDMPIYQSPEIFFTTAHKNNIQQLDIWQLGQTIETLKNAGSNVEGLRTVWHGKISYACSLVIMSLLGVAIVSLTANIYVAVFAGMASTFLLYSLVLFGESLGQRGILPPLIAAWFPNAIFFILSLSRLYIVSRTRFSN